MEVCRVDRSVLEVALASTTSDFEDAVQIVCALVQGIYQLAVVLPCDRHNDRQKDSNLFTLSKK